MNIFDKIVDEIDQKTNLTFEQKMIIEKELRSLALQIASQPVEKRERLIQLIQLDLLLDTELYTDINFKIR